MPTNTKLLDRSILLLFCAGPLVAGSLAAWLGLERLPKLESAWKYPQPWPPLWLFWIVWFVIYPSWGYATYRIWRRRHESDVRGALTYFTASFISGLFFMPLAALSGNNPAVMTLGDANGVISSWAFAWLYSRYDRQATLYLLPLLTWMPVTLALKIWYWQSNV